jgi:hypothetical protein
LCQDIELTPSKRSMEQHYRNSQVRALSHLDLLKG